MEQIKGDIAKETHRHIHVLGWGCERWKDYVEEKALARVRSLGGSSVPGNSNMSKNNVFWMFFLAMAWFFRVQGSCLGRRLSS